MRRNPTVYSLIVAIAIALPLLSTIGFTHAQSNDDTVLLPFVAGNGTGESTTEETPAAATPSGSTDPTAVPPTEIAPTETPAAPGNSFWDPPPTPSPTPTLSPSFPDWVPGRYNMRLETREGWGEFRSDGTFVERWSTFGNAGTRDYEGTWFVNNGRLFSAYTDHNGDFHTARFLIEETEDGFRLAGGDQKLGSILFERADPVDSVGSYADEVVPVSRWMRGRWSYLFGFTSYQIVLNEDGRYSHHQVSSFADEDELGAPFEVGQWSIWADQMIILTDGETLGDEHRYAITASTRGFINIEGGRFGSGDAGLLRKQFYPPNSMLAFEGQYQAGDVTMIIEREGDIYTADIVDEGNRITTGGVLDENNHLVLAKGSDDTYDPLAPDFNTLNFDGFEFPEWLPKVSETVWPLPPSNFGMWIVDYLTFSDSELWLLPDGRYITKSGSGFQTEGTYGIANGSITYDPICDGPYSREIEFVDNQMIQRSDGTVITYHYVPEKLGDTVAAMARRDQSEGQLNADFAATHSLAQRDPDYFVVPGGYVVADLNSDNVYADATVFQEAQVYQITFPVDPPEQIAFFLFPNGRYQFFSLTYVSLGGGVGEYQTLTGWGKYRVEDEVIYPLSDLGEAIELPLVLGRRRAMWNETCLDNLDWASEDNSLGD